MPWPPASKQHLTPASTSNCSLRWKPAAKPAASSAAKAACPSARVVLFGHIAEGSIHVNLLGAEPNEDAVTTAVLELVAELGGSISAEHGIGIAKTPWLHLTRSAADIAVMRAIKHAMDPAGTLNRRVIFPLDTIKL